MQESLYLEQEEPVEEEPSLRFFHYQGLEEGALEYQEALDIESMIQGGMNNILMFQKYMDRMINLSDTEKYRNIKRIQDLKRYKGVASSYKDFFVLIQGYFGDYPTDYLRSRIDRDYKRKNDSFRNSLYFATLNPGDKVFTHRFEVEAHTSFLRDGYVKMAPARLRLRMARIQKEGDHFKNIDFSGIRMDVLTIADRHVLVYDLEHDYGDSVDNNVGKIISCVADILIAHYRKKITVDVSDFITGIFQSLIDIAEENTGLKFSERPILILNYIKYNSKYHIETNKRYPLQSDSSFRILFQHMDDVERRIIDEQKRLHIEEKKTKIKRHLRSTRPRWDDDE
ncbi:MAG: hypothetical protein ACYDAS_01445 [Patescibacteria group bacterium]